MKSKSLLVLCLSSNLVFSQTTAIPDPNFEQALIALGYDTGALDGVVTTANIENVTSLGVSNFFINDLTGIEDFAALEVLYCDGNSLTTLDLSQNTQLYIVICNHNQISSLNISNSPGLFSLDCEVNQLTSLDVSIFPDLQYLNCGGNNLTSLDVSDNSLVLLACNENEITALDLTAQSQLEVLVCFMNQLTVLDVSENPQLEFLNASGNQLTALDISNNPAITEFFCSDNQLECLNAKNGNNTAFLEFDALLNPSLSCIQVDDPTWADANWADNADVGVSFSSSCENPCLYQLGLGEVPELSFEIYPNPSSGLVNLYLPESLSETCMITVSNIEGRVLFTQAVAAGTSIIQLNFETADLAAGIYLVKCAGGGFSGTQRLVIE